MIKTYSELIKIPSFKERYNYLQLRGFVGKETFGHDRYLNQKLYKSDEWKRFRNKIIIRDNGCDLGCLGYEILEKIIIIHHIIPITVEDIIRRDPSVFDPENAICTSLNTHNAIHYGDESLLITEPVERTKNDTCPWRQR